MTFSDIKKKIKNALDRFYSENGEMAEHWKTSRSYVHAFAKKLEEEFDSWDVDCFFVHYKKTKPFSFLEDDDFCCIHMDDSATCEECLNRKWCKACPDIIIHRRNSQDNLLVIQTELSCRNQSKKERDLLKLESYINQSADSYVYGLFINWAPSRNRVSLHWKSHSIIDQEKARERDKIKEAGNYFLELYRPYSIPRIKTETYIVGLIDILGTNNELKKQNMN